MKTLRLRALESWRHLRTWRNLGDFQDLPLHATNLCESVTLTICVLTSNFLRSDLWKLRQTPLFRNCGKVNSSPRVGKSNYTQAKFNTSYGLECFCVFFFFFPSLLLLSSLNSEKPENPFTNNRFSSMISGFEVGKKSERDKWGRVPKCSHLACGLERI